MFRTTLFWTHLAAGLVTGVVVFIMSFTGAAIALQPQILQWAEHDRRAVAVPPDGRAWIGPEALAARMREQRPDLTVTGITLDRDLEQAATVTLGGRRAGGEGGVAPAAGGRGGPGPGGPGRPGGPGPAGPGGPGGLPPQTTVWANPYTGAITGQLDQGSFWRRFMRVNTDWHRWLALTGDQRTIGRWITGVSNAAFLLLAVSGLYLWIPRVWSSAAVRAVTWPRLRLSGKARDFNWHNTFGLWFAPVLVVLTLTGLYISFPKSYDITYAVTGIEPPAGPQRPGGAPTGPGPAAGGAPRMEQRPRGEPGDTPGASLDAMWAEAEMRMPSWRSIAMRLPAQPGQPVVLTMNDAGRLNPMARSTLTLDAASGAVVRWEPYEQVPVAQRLRTWMRFGHTGELWGLPGQIVAGLASALACLLVWTGVALAWRRCTAWRARRISRLRRASPVTS